MNHNTTDIYANTNWSPNVNDSILVHNRIDHKFSIKQSKPRYNTTKQPIINHQFTKPVDPKLGYRSSSLTHTCNRSNFSNCLPMLTCSIWIPLYSVMITRYLVFISTYLGRGGEWKVQWWGPEVSQSHLPCIQPEMRLQCSFWGHYVRLDPLCPYQSSVTYVLHNKTIINEKYSLMTSLYQQYFTINQPNM